MSEPMLTLPAAAIVRLGWAGVGRGATPQFGHPLEAGRRTPRNPD